MEQRILNIFNKMGFCNSFDDLDGLSIDRDFFLNDNLYYNIKSDIINLKSIISSSNVSVVQDNADIVQKWPLLNFTRQMLKLLGYTMQPIRKANGYDQHKKKIFKRFFVVKKK